MHVFNFIATANNPSDYQHIFINSLVLGFVLKNIFGLAPFRFDNYYTNVVLFIIGCVILAYAVAKIYATPFVERVLRRLGIKRTFNQYIWKDIEDYDKPLWVRVKINSIDRIYYGVLVLYEDFERKPQIVLSEYEEHKLNGMLVENNLGKRHKRVVIDTDKCDDIKLVYYKDSEYLNIEDGNVLDIIKKKFQN